MKVFTIAHAYICFPSFLPFPAETQQVRVQYSSAPSKILNYRAKLRSRCLSKVSDQCTIAIQLYRRLLFLRMPSPRFSCQSPDLKLRCATLAFQWRTPPTLNLPPWDKFRDNEAEQGGHVVAAKAEEAPLLGAVAHQEAAHVFAALEGNTYWYFTH